MPLEYDKWGWEHVTVFGGFHRGSGTKRWKCNHCNLRYNGSYSRVRAHLLGFSGLGVKSCPAIDRSQREAFQILEEERLAKKKKKSPRNDKPSKHIQTSQPSLVTKEDVDDAVARFFYASGLNIDVVNSPYFNEMVKGIGSFGDGYEAPSTDKLYDLFLRKERGRIEKSVSQVRESWPHTGCTILCVGHVDGELSNFHIDLFVSSPRGLVFLKAVDVDISDDGDQVFTAALCDTIVEVGPSNVLQIISQLGDACKTSESYVLSKFPNIFWSSCTSRSILKMMKEIAELEWAKPIIMCAKAIEERLMAYPSTSSCLHIQNLESSSDTTAAKFAPSYCFLQKIVELKQGLQELVVSEDSKIWKHNFKDEFVSIESAILGDDFWNKAQLLLELYEPFVRLIDVLDVDKSVIGTVYDWRVQALETLKNKAIDGSVLNQLEELIENKWDLLFSPLHAAGYILNPRYIGKGQAKNKSVMRDWKATIEKLECESTARRILREQLSSYWHLEGSLGEEDAVDCRDKMDPVAWWENFGSETPNLQTLAIKVLSQVSGVGLCQDIWKTSDFSYQETPSKLGIHGVEDLMFVRNNLRLHGRRNGYLTPFYGHRNGYLIQFLPKNVALSSSSCLRT
ncbi:hypothetical protein K2173_020708 [Erythroxylum novogranatense]|uniref:DUF659 domain-containing protein n=1 Tax=Erythroxylum novogranatense TaxID=1862640 RepID=A0AAV8TNK2_9ROSI|nr:hypothetical protein K2173_020708 [Erythroxylum novogranatense]